MNKISMTILAVVGAVIFLGAASCPGARVPDDKDTAPEHVTGTVLEVHDQSDFNKANRPNITCKSGYYVIAAPYGKDYVCQGTHTGLKVGDTFAR